MDEIDLVAASSLPKRGEELFRVFSRFEYALKDAGFANAPIEGGDVNADWDAFANQRLGHNFFKVVREGQLAPTLLFSPPSKQVLQNGALAWREMTRPQNVQELFVAVRRVRNNLFHGGKSGKPDADRNSLLVVEAITVLLEALRACDDIRYTFENRW